jgi:hypothetical protein
VFQSCNIFLVKTNQNNIHQELNQKRTQKISIMSTKTKDNSNVDTNRKSEKENPELSKLKKCKSNQHSQECPNYSPQGHGPPSKDIGTMYYDSKFVQSKLTPT